ncbi:efflux RND transporter periplasmic adaptor subunit [Acidocella facilis]|uniref:efflux RND transporter periplasmic adaptor subunit n=1 Tax=Acidocella facilis TaxID=525 RepID=UPI001FD5648C|nr:efflux RND transporter periplasmic adaptor subunit [Acidocella facilis]
MAVREGQRKRGKGRYVIALVVILLVAFIWWRHSGQRQHGYGPVPQSVVTAKAVSGPMPVILDELGTVTPTATVTLLPQISGYITQIAFTEGQMVQKGQFLVQIDPRPYQIQLEQYQAALAKDQASLDQARSDYARYLKLEAQNSISAQTVSDQKFTVAQDAAAVKSDQANIDTAKLDLAYCHITSPVTGRIGLRLVDLGNYVTSGSSTGLAVVTTISPTTVEFSVAQQDLTQILEQLEQGRTLQASAYESDDVTKLEDGTLSAVDNQVNTSTGMVKLRADFANTDNKLFPNQFVNVHLLVKTLQNATLVPSPAVQEGAPGAYVYVVQPDNTVKMVPVTTGPTDGFNTVITKGVSPGDEVVVDGVDRLTDGSKITPSGRETVTTNGAPEAIAPSAASQAPSGKPGGWHHKKQNGQAAGQ